MSDSVVKFNSLTTPAVGQNQPPDLTRFEFSRRAGITEGSNRSNRSILDFSVKDLESDYFVSQRILMSDSTELNSGSLVRTMASSRWAVATQKASA